jgi:hypothetical protein
MAIISGGQVIPSTGDYSGTSAPSNGTNAVQTITITNATGGNFTLSYDGHTTSAIAWNATAATLVASIDTALEALGPIGTNGVTVANSTLNNGNGNVTVTFNGPYSARRLVSALSASYTGITGTNAVVTVNAITTNGVNATVVRALQGARYTDTTNGKLYVNDGDDASPTWAVQA